MRHPQEVPLVSRSESGAFLPTKENAQIRDEINEIDSWEDPEPYEHAYRTQLSRQMLDLSKGEE